jgi:hypothetical protein
MNRPEKYRQKAVECYEAARILSDPRQKAKLLAMAQSWISLADLAERNSHLDRIDETPPRRESHFHLGNGSLAAPWAPVLLRASRQDWPEYSSVILAWFLPGLPAPDLAGELRYATRPGAAPGG